MMGQQSQKELLFYYFRLEDQIPETHLLRLIDRSVDFSFVRDRLTRFYSPTGHPRLTRKYCCAYSLAGLNHGLGTTDINSGAGNPASPGSLEDPLPIIRQAHMSSRSSLLGSPVRLSPSHVSLSCRGGNDGEALSKVGCVAEATGGDAAMFSVVQLHVLPHGFE